MPLELVGFCQTSVLPLKAECLSHLLLALVGRYSIPASLSPRLLLSEEKQKEPWLKNLPVGISKGFFREKLVGSLLDLAPRGLAVSESSSRLVRARGKLCPGYHGS